MENSYEMTINKIFELHFFVEDNQSLFLLQIGFCEDIKKKHGHLVLSKWIFRLAN